MDTVTPTSVALVKEQKLDLTKGTGLTLLCIGLGWDVATSGGDVDLDATIIALNAERKLKDSGHVLYFGSPKNAAGQPCILNGAMIHSGDNLTGAGDGDDETLTIDLTKLPDEVVEMEVFINIFQADSRNQKFGMVKNAFARMYDGTTKAELAKYDLNEDYSSNTGVLMVRIYKHNGEWKVQALGNGKNGSINDILKDY